MVGIEHPASCVSPSSGIGLRLKSSIKNGRKAERSTLRKFLQHAALVPDWRNGAARARIYEQPAAANVGTARAPSLRAGYPQVKHFTDPFAGKNPARTKDHGCSRGLRSKRETAPPRG